MVHQVFKFKKTCKKHALPDSGSSHRQVPGSVLKPDTSCHFNGRRARFEAYRVRLGIVFRMARLVQRIGFGPREAIGMTNDASGEQLAWAT